MKGWTVAAYAGAGVASAYLVAAWLYRRQVKLRRKADASALTSDSAEDDGPPVEFLCPITHALMAEPYTASDGHTYERQAIVEWLMTHDTSPSTGEVLPNLVLQPNRLARCIITTYRDTHGLEQEPSWAPAALDMRTVRAQQRAQGHPGQAAPRGIAGQRPHPQADMLGAHQHQHQHQHQQHHHVVIQGPMNVAMQHQLHQQLHQQIHDQIHQHARAQAQAQAQAPQQADGHVPPHVAAHPANVGPNARLPPFAHGESIISPASLQNITEARDQVKVYARALPMVPDLNLGVLKETKFPGSITSAVEQVIAKGTLSIINAKLFATRGNQEASLAGLQAHHPLQPVPQLQNTLMAEPARMPALCALIDGNIAFERLVQGQQPQLPPLLGSLLHIAALRGQERFVQVLLNQQQDVNKRDIFDRTPLHLAAFEGHVNVCRVLLDAGAEPCSKSKAGFTPLHMAAASGADKVIELLLPYNTSVTAAEVTASGSTALHLAALSASPLVVEKLYKHAPTAIGKMDAVGYTPLHYAALRRPAEGLKLLVSIVSQEVACTSTRDSLSLVHLAAATQDGPQLEWLMQKTQGVRERDQRDNTPLHLAALLDNPNACTFLADHKPEWLEARNHRGETPLHTAIWTASNAAIRALLEAGADVHARTNNGSTSLHLACWNGLLPVVRSLLDANAVYDDVTNDGDTPLHQAIYRKEVVIASILLDIAKEREQGRNLQPADRYVNRTNERGDTALHLACQTKSRPAVSLLLEYNADTKVANRAGKLPVDVAPQALKEML